MMFKDVGMENFLFSLATSPLFNNVLSKLPSPHKNEVTGKKYLVNQAEFWP